MQKAKNCDQTMLLSVKKKNPTLTIELKFPLENSTSRNLEPFQDLKPSITFRLEITDKTKVLDHKMKMLFSTSLSGY